MLSLLPQFQKSFEELEQKMQNPNIFNNTEEIKKISKKFNETKEIIENLEKLKSLGNNIEQTK